MALSLFIFAAVTFGLIGGYYAFTGMFRRDAWLVRQRMDTEFAKAEDGAGTAQLFKKLEGASLDKAVPDFDDPDRPPAPPAPDRGLHDRLQTLLDQSALRVTVRQLLIAAAGLGLVLGTACTLALGPLAGPAGALAGAAAPLAYVNARRNARRDKVLGQLPAAFELMSRVIRAGQSVPQALQAVSDAFEGPIAAEFAACQQQQHLGMRPEVAFNALAQRTGILEMRIFVMALIIQRQSGGNLSEALERIARLVRDRIRLRNQVRTLTAEGRLQGVTLLVLPVLIFFLMMFINRAYAEVLLEQPYLLTATGASMLIGALWIRKIVKFDP
jgi:tight adherence protein B